MDSADSKAPRHIAIILDGNRRYAKKMGFGPWVGHSIGVKRVRSIIEWCMDLGVKELTLYCFSTENFKRPEKEVNFLFRIFTNEFNRMRNRKDIMNNGIRVKAIGKTSMLPKELVNSIKNIVYITRKNDRFVVNFALAYGGRQEIVDSAARIARGVKNGRISLKDIDESLFGKCLNLSSEPDMLIRPGGEKRISNFLLWQCAYSEIFFVEKFWPEFTKDDLESCIEEFGKRTRRFGE